ncbi:MAG TPA: hypothetical protein VHY91_03210 [Pirellulales bacterium]|jgi:hypothetical protein|nr:hypothetical protein [Pirellulales bacterium]
MTHSDQEIYRRQKIGLVWLAAYLITTGLIVWSVYLVRARTMQSLDTPESRAAWEEWRQAAAQSSAGVQHAVPSSPEAPGLVLMRDHFGVMLAAAIVFGSVLFAVMMFFIRGAMKSDDRGHD